MSRNFCHDRFTCGNFIISVCGRIQLQYDCSSRSLDATHILRRVGKNRKIVLSKLFCRCEGYLGTISTVRCVVNVILSKYPILYPIVLQQQVSSISHYLICDCANRFTLRGFYIYVMSRSWYGEQRQEALSWTRRSSRCTWCSSVKRENLIDLTFSCFHKNVNGITHLYIYHRNITRTATSIHKYD